MKKSLIDDPGFIYNVALSARHDFGLLSKEEQATQLRFIKDCIVSYEKEKGIVKNLYISRLEILNTIFDYFCNMTQWFDISTENVLKDDHSANSLIEVLEVADCGSIGGYDSENPHKVITGYRTFDRFLTVLYKYNKEEDLKNRIPELTVNFLKTYFTELSNLRNKILK